MILAAQALADRLTTATIEDNPLAGYGVNDLIGAETVAYLKATGALLIAAANADDPEALSAVAGLAQALAESLTMVEASATPGGLLALLGDALSSGHTFAADCPECAEVLGDDAPAPTV